MKEQSLDEGSVGILRLVKGQHLPVPDKPFVRRNRDAPEMTEALDSIGII